ncbi:hypothetical protein GCM10010420_30450 [Streptomyces glaucosporus]|uniref:Uncharacterized protein n=1 Tax=Streptomyces glaucosporus TaxID=284044 RepID=A0ABP5VF28_9ACTN
MCACSVKGEKTITSGTPWARPGQGAISRPVLVLDQPGRRLARRVGRGGRRESFPRLGGGRPAHVDVPARPVRHGRPRLAHGAAGEPDGTGGAGGTGGAAGR